MDFETYKQIDAVNATVLKEFARSPRHAWHAMQKQDEESKALSVGTAAHTWLLEPHKFDENVCVATQCAAVKKDGEQCNNSGNQRHAGQWYCGVKGHLPGSAESVSQVVVSQSDFDNMKIACNSILNHHDAAQLITATGDNEVTLTATHEPTGLLLKCRLDMLRPQFATIADLKTCRDASHKGFPRDCFNLRYYLQAGFYFHVAKMSGLDIEHFVFVALEKTPPFNVSVFRVMDEVLDAAWSQCEAMLHQFAECKASGHWPGYVDDDGNEGTVVDLSLPAWAEHQLMAQE